MEIILRANLTNLIISIMPKTLSESDTHYHSSVKNYPSIRAQSAARLLKNLNFPRATVYGVWKKLGNGVSVDRKVHQSVNSVQVSGEFVYSTLILSTNVCTLCCRFYMHIS